MKNSKINIITILKLVSSDLIKLPKINLASCYLDHIELNESFSELKTHKNLRKFKIKKSSFDLKSFVPKNIFRNFIAKSKLVALSLSNIKFFTPKFHKELEEGIKQNQSITSLKLKSIKFLEDKNHEIKIISFFSYFSNLSSKNNLEKLP